MKRAGLNWFKKGREYADEAYEHRYISERLPGGRRIVMFFYTGKSKRYVVELHNFYDGGSECYCDIGTWWSFNSAARGAVEWFTLSRLEGEI